MRDDSGMNDQMKRLYEAAKELRGVDGQTNVANLLNASPQLIANWERRGISNEGLLTAQDIIGCDAIWLRDGVGSMSKAPRSEAVVLEGAIELLEFYKNSTVDGRSFILSAAASASKRV